MRFCGFSRTGLQRCQWYRQFVLRAPAACLKDLLSVFFLRISAASLNYLRVPATFLFLRSLAGHTSERHIRFQVWFRQAFSVSYDSFSSSRRFRSLAVELGAFRRQQDSGKGICSRNKLSGSGIFAENGGPGVYAGIRLITGPAIFLDFGKRSKPCVCHTACNSLTKPATSVHACNHGSAIGNLHGYTFISLTLI